MEKFRIVETFTSYSKKKGAYQKNITIEKNIATLTLAQQRVKEYKSTARQISPTEYKTSGLLYPGSINIKKHKI